MLTVANKPIMVSVVMLSVANKPITLSVVMLSSKFLKLVLRSIEYKVEFDVYCSFLLSSIVIAIELKYLRK